LVLEDSAKVLIYEVIEDEGKGFRSLARHMLLADCVESIEEQIEPVADTSSLTLLVDWASLDSHKSRTVSADCHVPAISMSFVF
jgi:hypothetical protein